MKTLSFLAVIVTLGLAALILTPVKFVQAESCPNHSADLTNQELSLVQLENELDQLRNNMEINEYLFRVLMDKDAFISIVKDSGENWTIESEAKHTRLLNKIWENKKSLAREEKLLKKFIYYAALGLQRMKMPTI